MDLRDNDPPLCRGCGVTLRAGGQRRLGVCVQCVARPVVAPATSVPAPGYRWGQEESS